MNKPTITITFDPRQRPITYVRDSMGYWRRADTNERIQSNSPLAEHLTLLAQMH